MSKTLSLGSFVTLFCVKSSCYLLLWRTIVQRVFSHNSRQRQVVIEHLQNGKSDLHSSIFHMLSFILTWLLQKATFFCTSSIVSIISTSLSESISGASVLNSVFNSWASGVVIMAAAGANVVVGVGLLVVVLLVEVNLSKTMLASKLWGKAVVVLWSRYMYGGLEVMGGPGSSMESCFELAFNLLWLE